MNNISIILKELEKCDFNVSTDTRKDLRGTVFFGLKGENFDGNKFILEALKMGAVCAVTENPKIEGKKIYFVKNSLKTLQEIALWYRGTFNIPIIAIGGSNGKTTSKELTRDVLKIEFKTHATAGSLNNHVGVPLSILSMESNAEIGIFEIGANHPKEHFELLDILKPTHVVVTNNGMDHLDGFGSVQGARKANKEIYDWALINSADVFVNKKQEDLIKDSIKNNRILYPDKKITYESETPLVLKNNSKIYKTNLAGSYNLENIELAVSIGNNFGIKTDNALKVIGKYKPTLRRSQIKKIKNNTYIIDCYNANPTSMKLSLESFLKSVKNPFGLILGDMLELGKYSKNEHKKILEYILTKKINTIVLIGKEFKKVISKKNKNIYWFKNSEDAGVWFKSKKFEKYTFLLKGSRGIQVEKVIE